MYHAFIVWFWRTLLNVSCRVLVRTGMTARFYNMWHINHYLRMKYVHNVLLPSINDVCIRH